MEFVDGGCFEKTGRKGGAMLLKTQKGGSNQQDVTRSLRAETVVREGAQHMCLVDGVLIGGAGSRDRSFPSPSSTIELKEQTRRPDR